MRRGRWPLVPLRLMTNRYHRIADFSEIKIKIIKRYGYKRFFRQPSYS